MIVSETWSRRGDGVFARESDREQGPRQEEDGADQALPGRLAARATAQDIRQFHIYLPDSYKSGGATPTSAHARGSGCKRFCTAGMHYVMQG